MISLQNDLLLKYFSCNKMHLCDIQFHVVTLFHGVPFKDN